MLIRPVMTPGKRGWVAKSTECHYAGTLMSRKKHLPKIWTQLLLLWQLPVPHAQISELCFESAIQLADNQPGRMLRPAGNISVMAQKQLSCHKSTFVAVTLKRRSML